MHRHFQLARGSVCTLEVLGSGFLISFLVNCKSESAIWNTKKTMFHGTYYTPTLLSVDTSLNKRFTVVTLYLSLESLYTCR